MSEFFAGLPDLFARLVESAQRMVWGPVMMVLLLGAGLYFTVRTGFFQLRHAKRIWNRTLGDLLHGRAQKSENGMTPFQAMSTALASTVGTGNIVGVAGALMLAGPGAVFWMWVSALLGAMTKYAEVVLAQKYRRPDGKGGHMGGPMVVMRDGLKRPRLGALYAILCLVASLGVGNMVQSSAATEVVTASWPVSPSVVGLILAVVVGAVVVGGARSIARVTERLVPFMALLFLVFALIVIGCHADRVIPAFASIFREAFRFGPMAAGAGGYLLSRTLRVGLARGVFSNEAGLGSAAIAHAAAEVKEPVEQGFWGIMEVFLDTIVICTVTALVILTSGVYSLSPLPAAPSEISSGALTSLPVLSEQPLAMQAFTGTLGSVGGFVLTVCTVLFAVATIIGWYYYGEVCVGYLFTKSQKRARYAYRLFYVLAVYPGAVMRVDVVWQLADVLNGLLALPNMLSLLLLSGVVFAETKRYQRSLREDWTASAPTRQRIRHKPL